jgi:hypothetical protein
MQDKAVAMEFEVESAHWMFCVRMGSVGTAEAFSEDGQVWKPKDPRDPVSLFTNANLIFHRIHSTEDSDGCGSAQNYARERITRLAKADHSSRGKTRRNSG